MSLSPRKLVFFCAAISWVPCYDLLQNVLKIQSHRAPHSGQNKTNVKEKHHKGNSAGSSFLLTHFILSSNLQVALFVDLFIFPPTEETWLEEEDGGRKNMALKQDVWYLGNDEVK